MKNKTCGDCANCAAQTVIATCKHIGIVTGNVPACAKFTPKPMTNGDKIRAMGNAELAEFLLDAAVADDIANHCMSQDDILAWLNAPAAESEGENECNK